MKLVIVWLDQEAVAVPVNRSHCVYNMLLQQNICINAHFRKGGTLHIGHISVNISGYTGHILIIIWIKVL